LWQSPYKSGFGPARVLRDGAHLVVEKRFEKLTQLHAHGIRLATPVFAGDFRSSTSQDLF
jgi:hypothetical protein